MRKKLLVLALIALPITFMVSCGSTNTEAKKIVEGTPKATIEIEGFGIIKADLYPNKAPNTVSNFVELANNEFYDGLTIHRVVKDFVLQGGCSKGDGTGGPEYSIKGEFKSNGFAENDIKHKKGVLSMARSRSKDSAGSQFFIMTGDASHLDGDYAAFGIVTEGMDVVDKINGVNTRAEQPVEKIVIKDVKIDLNGTTLPKVEKIK
ncbi:MAG: peptidylprolyl isomerase [Sarcina sp.]